MKNKFFKSCLSAGLAAVLAVGNGGILSQNQSFAAETADDIYTISFDLNGYECKDTLEPVQVKAGTSYAVTSAIPITSKTEDFGGWTCDDIFAYEGTDYFVMPDHDVVFHPVIVDLTDENVYKLIYDTGDYEVTVPLDSKKYSANCPAKVGLNCCEREGYVQIGWTDGEHAASLGQKFIMPAHDLVLTPNWVQIFNIYYEAGDVDNIKGKAEIVMDKREGVSFELGDKDRLSRTGYNLTGWLCDYDNKEHKINETFVMPSADVHFTAVWTPAVYPFTYYSNNSFKQKLNGECSFGDKIKLPECHFRQYGYKCTGWAYKGTPYEVGGEFVVPSIFAGQSITLSAQWEEDPEFDKDAQVDVFTMLETRKNFNEQKTDETDLTITSGYVLGNY